MGTARKGTLGSRTLWIHLATGLLWMFVAARNLFWPGLLSMYSRSSQHKEDAILPFVVGTLFLATAAISFYRGRNV